MVKSLKALFGKREQADAGKIVTKMKKPIPVVNFEEFFYTARKFGKDLPVDENGNIILQKAVQAILEENGASFEIDFNNPDEILEALVKNPGSEIKLSVRDSHILFAKYGEKFAVGEDGKFYLLDEDYNGEEVDAEKKYKLVRVSNDYPDVVSKMTERLDVRNREFTANEAEKINRYIEANDTLPSNIVNEFYFVAKNKLYPNDWLISLDETCCFEKEMSDGQIKKINMDGYRIYGKDGFVKDAKFWQGIWSEYIKSDEFKNIESEAKKSDAKTQKRILKDREQQATIDKIPLSHQNSLFEDAHDKSMSIDDEQIVKKTADEIVTLPIAVTKKFRYTNYDSFIAEVFQNERFGFLISPLQSCRRIVRQSLATNTYFIIPLSDFVSAFGVLIQDGESTERFNNDMSQQCKVDVLVSDYIRNIEMYGGRDILLGFASGSKNNYTAVMYQSDGAEYIEESVKINLHSLMLLDFGVENKDIFLPLCIAFEKNAEKSILLAYGIKQIEKYKKSKEEDTHNEP